MAEVGSVVLSGHRGHGGTHTAVQEPSPLSIPSSSAGFGEQHPAAHDGHPHRGHIRVAKGTAQARTAIGGLAAPAPSLRCW